MTKNLDALLVTASNSVPGTIFGRAPRIVTIDIETAPNLVYAWNLFQTTISPSQIVKPSRVLCFAAKWHGTNKVEYFSEYHNTREEMIRAAWHILDEADIVIGYNSPNFDIKHLQREFILLGLTPPSPFINVDLLQTARRQFKFPSNKLEHVASALGLGHKLTHTGQDLWNRVLLDDPKAWATMKRYNKQDVVLTEALFDYLGPWVKNMPNLALWSGARSCFRCGHGDLLLTGWARKSSSVYAKLQCQGCGAWNRLSSATGRVETKPLV